MDKDIVIRDINIDLIDGWKATKIFLHPEVPCILSIALEKDSKKLRARFDVDSAIFLDEPKLQLLINKKALGFDDSVSYFSLRLSLFSELLEQCNILIERGTLTDEERAQQVFELIDSAKNRGIILDKIREKFCSTCFSNIEKDQRCWGCFESDPCD